MTKITDNIADLRKKLESRLDRFAKLEASYKAVMAMTDTELRIYNLNRLGASSPVKSDPVYQKSQSEEVLFALENRTMTEGEYVTQLFPGLANKTLRTRTEQVVIATNGYKPTSYNGNGRNGTHSFRGPPPGYAIALGGDLVPIAQLAEANRGFIQNTRMR